MSFQTSTAVLFAARASRRSAGTFRMGRRPGLCAQKMNIDLIECRDHDVHTTVDDVGVAMNKAQWLQKAKKLHGTCLDDLRNKSSLGTTQISVKDATTLQELQRAIGSDHGRKEKLTYKQVRVTLDEMFDMVKKGQKDDLLK